jgi:uncharacterized damage-inducible protein DinB
MIIDVAAGGTAPAARSALMTTDAVLRDHLGRLLSWEDAHVAYDQAVDGIPPELQGVRPARLPHSAWEIVEHLRITQHDILDFCRNPAYRELDWPAGYWPSTMAPPDENAWEGSRRRYRHDRRALQQLAADPAVDLGARIPHGSGQTYLRELILVADHSAYHVGQIVLVRRLLGIWR